MPKLHILFYPEGSDTVVYSHDIPEIYMVSESEYSEKWNELMDLIQALWRELKENDQEAWANLNLVLESTGKFKIFYL